MSKNTGQTKSRANQTRSTVVHSGLAGAAAGVLAATISSPAGALAVDSFGQAVGVKFDFSAGLTSAQDEAEALIAPFTSLELRQIRERLADSANSIESARTATDAEIEYMRALAARPGLRIRRRPQTT